MFKFKISKEVITFRQCFKKNNKWNNYKAHILVVDDDDGIRELVKQFLNQNNYLVTTAKSSEDALEKSQNN